MSLTPPTCLDNYPGKSSGTSHRKPCHSETVGRGNLLGKSFDKENAGAEHTFFCVRVGRFQREIATPLCGSQ